MPNLLLKEPVLFVATLLIRISTLLIILQSRVHKKLRTQLYKVRMRIVICLSLGGLILILPTYSFSQALRWKKNLSGPDWKLYLDRNAKWEDDVLFFPPIKLETIPVNAPTCGWENLKYAVNKIVAVPGTVEGYFWSTTDSTGKMAGDYRGVSWWSKTFSVPANVKGKRLMLAFQSVNLRAEVFVNKKLVGYDIIGNTPFELDISKALRYGGINSLDIRITDIGGTFSWDDERAIIWGKNKIPSVHGFGGITGDVELYATDQVYIDDIYIQNQADPRKAKIFVTLDNARRNEVNGAVNLTISENFKTSKKTILSQSKKIVVKGDKIEVEFNLNAKNAKLWEVKDPHLYKAEVVFTSKDRKVKDVRSQNFGFRFLNIGSKDGDSRLYFNGKRIFLLAAMTRGFWPKMGMFPMNDMAERDIKQVIDLGYNMIMYHRAIGQPTSMDLCDEKGILTYEEPGGYQSLPYPPSELAQKWRKEKLKRMVLRDRSRPSLSNWNLDDWSYNKPNDWDYENINMVHKLDPSRIVTFNCIQIPVDSVIKQNPFQLHMLPFDNKYYYDGWTSPYHFAAQQGYVDEYYKNPRNFARLMLDPNNNTLGDSSKLAPKDQIYFLGEEGAFGTQLNLERIKGDLDKYGADGWMDKDYLNWYQSYSKFLDESKMRNAFPTVESLTTKMGHNLHYFHGRIIENVRMMNTADGYVLNGWSGAQTNTDIVDTYRHSTGDPTILPYYAQPLYVAVKFRNKVLPSGTIPVADIYLINEKNIRGKHKLRLSFAGVKGNVLFTKVFDTEVKGGEEFGQLLIENVVLPKVEKNGYYKLSASLIGGNEAVKAKGFDDLFVADYREPINNQNEIAVIDTSGSINSFLQASQGISLKKFDPNGPRPGTIVIGLHDASKIDVKGILNMVKQGTHLLVLENARGWIEQLPVKQITGLNAAAPGRQPRNLNGRQFVGIDPIFEGLPQATAMSWEYQVFYRKGGDGLSITPEGLKTIVGVGPTNTGQIGIALCQLPYGEGRVILSTLSIVPNLTINRMDSSVAKKLFINLLNDRK